MAATKTRTSSFTRNVLSVSSSQIPGVKCGPNGTFFVSSGISDLDSNVLPCFSLFFPALSDFFLLNNSGENYVYIYIYISFSFQMIFACLDSNLFFPVPNV